MYFCCCYFCFIISTKSNRKKSKNLKKTYFWNTLDLNDCWQIFLKTILESLIMSLFMKKKYNYKIIFYYKNNICIYVRCQKYWRTLCVCVGAIINNIKQLCFCDCSSCVRLKVSSGNRQVFKVLRETVCWDGGGLEQVSVSICTNVNIYKYYLKSFCIYLSFFFSLWEFQELWAHL